MPETLPPNQAEALATLMEECGEIVKVAGKILRYGVDSSNPVVPGSPTNRTLLESEIGDLLVSIALAVSSGLVDKSRVDAASASKAGRIGLHNNPAPSVEEIEAMGCPPGIMSLDDPGTLEEIQRRLEDHRLHPEKAVLVTCPGCGEPGLGP